RLRLLQPPRGGVRDVRARIRGRRRRCYLSALGPAVLRQSLPDPKGLLEGSGAKVRSVTLKAASDLDHGDIQALFKAAIKHSGVTFPKTRSTRMVIKSESKKQRPRRTGHAEPGAAPDRGGT